MRVTQKVYPEEKHWLDGNKQETGESKLANQEQRREADPEVDQPLNKAKPEVESVKRDDG